MSLGPGLGYLCWSWIKGLSLGASYHPRARNHRRGVVCLFGTLQRECFAPKLTFLLLGGLPLGSRLWGVTWEGSPGSEGTVSWKAC